MTGVHCEMAAEWEAPCDTPEWAAGGWQEGEDGNIHKRRIQELQTRYNTGTGPPFLPWDSRRRLLLGTD